MSLMKKLLLSCTIVFFTATASAQLIDLMSNMAIQGQVSNQGVQQTGRALNMIKQNSVIYNMNMVINDIKMMHHNDYTKIHKKNLMNIPDVEWDVGPYEKNKFFIELKNIDSASCNRFITSFTNVQQIFVNNSLNRKCLQNNSIKFVFH